MLGQIVFYTLTTTEVSAVGMLAGGATHPAIVTAVKASDIRMLTVFLPHGQHTWVRREVPAGDPQQQGTWDAAAA